MLLLFFMFVLPVGAVGAVGAKSPESPPKGLPFRLQRGGCPQFWFSFNGRCYKYVATHMTWADAELHCVSLRANLVSIHSAQENNFVKSLIRNFDPAEGLTWVGLSDIHKESSWMWSDGCPARFFSWSSGEPNNLGNEHCVHTNFGSQKKWNDVSCVRLYPSVCATRTFCA